MCIQTPFSCTRLKHIPQSNVSGFQSLNFEGIGGAFGKPKQF